MTAFIFARGGSQGIKKKNLQKIGDKTLLEHSITVALKVKRVSEVVVSTDNDEIAEVALKAGAIIPFIRPKNLATNEASEWKAWQHAIKEMRSIGNKIDTFLSIPTTSPLRSVQDIDNCIDKLEKENADIVITIKKSERSPYFNMVKLDKASRAHLVINSNYHRRQDAPEIFEVTTVAYAAKADFILNSSGIFEGNVKTSIVPPERAIDIDTTFDLEIAKFLYNNK
ncbi:MAG: acylneuraminate cytidylyltransferase family protein [Proteobacteria bacterium]|nr:acylneuraminate cytidylyltransferase family protein [Pseudomonadota bacterium]